MDHCVLRHIVIRRGAMTWGKFFSHTPKWWGFVMSQWVELPQNVAPSSRVPVTAVARQMPVSTARRLQLLCHSIGPVIGWYNIAQYSGLLFSTCLTKRLMSCSSALPSARQKSVFACPKQRATLSVGSVLKWRARPQCLRRRLDFVLQMNNTFVLQMNNTPAFCLKMILNIYETNNLKRIPTFVQ
jgi:hypothetical protein